MSNPQNRLNAPSPATETQVTCTQQVVPSLFMESCEMRTKENAQ